MSLPRRCLFLLLALAPFVACGDGEPPVSPMDTAIAELMARPEGPDEAITLNHILMSFQGTPRAKATRSKDEAKALAEKVWAEVMAGADFKSRMAIDDDPGPGEYPMTKAKRSGMVPGFGNVGFRLKVGEIGVAPWHAEHSPYGWHIIKRVK